MKERTEKSMQLYHMLVKRGYPEDLCKLISQNLNTDFTANRMIGYLSHYKQLPETELVDEMLAILVIEMRLCEKKRWNMHRQR